MGKLYEVYFEGTVTIESDEELDDDDALEKVADILKSDGRTWLDNSVSINNAEVLDVNEDEVCE